MPGKKRSLRKLFTCGKNVKDGGLKEGFRRNKGRQRGFAKLTLKLTEPLWSFVFSLTQVLGSTVYVADFAVNKWLCQNIITPE